MLARWLTVPAIGIAAIGACLGSAGRAAASSYSVLYSFSAGAAGGNPAAGLIAGPSGTFYGTAENGGGSNAGTVFALTLAAGAWKVTPLHGFKSGADGAHPVAPLIADSSGKLYGTTSGDASGGGTAFRLTPPVPGQTRWSYLVLHGFCLQSTCTDGSRPHTALTMDKSGALYGATQYGGANGSGTVFKLAPPVGTSKTWTETVLYQFCATVRCGDGAGPIAGMLLDQSGTLYGTTASGGGNNRGTVFRLAPPGAGKTAWTETVLYSFCAQANCSDGSAPAGDLIADSSGALYGTTQFGAAGGGFGTVFKLTPPSAGQTTWTLTTLHRFAGNADGCQPLGGVVADQTGALYGSAWTCGLYDAGLIFKLTPPAAGQTQWTDTVLYSLKGQANGANPIGRLTFDSTGALYGATQFGGRFGQGALFGLIP